MAGETTEIRFGKDSVLQSMTVVGNKVTVTFPLPKDRSQLDPNAVSLAAATGRIPGSSMSLRDFPDDKESRTELTLLSAKDIKESKKRFYDASFKELHSSDQTSLDNKEAQARDQAIQQRAKKIADFQASNPGWKVLSELQVQQAATVAALRDEKLISNDDAKTALKAMRLDVALPPAAKAAPQKEGVERPSVPMQRSTAKER
jgi:hypothetical protein